jgi:hypothetical protein
MLSVTDPGFGETAVGGGGGAHHLIREKGGLIRCFLCESMRKSGEK